MKLNKLIALPILTAALALASVSNANAATSNATLTIQNFTDVTTSDSVTMTPTLAEIQAMEKASTGAITLSVVTNNGTGCKVTVSAAAGDSRATKITPSDIEIKSATEGTDALFADFKALSTSTADLWNTTGASVDGTDVVLDVKFKNLNLYPTSAAGVTKNYTNVITFTAVANS
jgi:hypothetical protein